MCVHTLSKPSPIIHPLPPSHFYPLCAHSHLDEGTFSGGLLVFSPSLLAPFRPMKRASWKFFMHSLKRTAPRRPLRPLIVIIVHAERRREGTVFLFRCLWLPHGWAGSRGKRRAALGVRRKERQSAMRSVLIFRRFGTGCAKWRKSDIYDPYSSPPKSSCESNNVYSFSQPRSQLPCFVMTMRKS